MVRYFKASVFGVTWKATVIWIVIFLIGEGLGYQVDNCKGYVKNCKAEAQKPDITVATNPFKTPQTNVDTPLKPIDTTPITKTE